MPTTFASAPDDMEPTAASFLASAVMLLMQATMLGINSFLILSTATDFSILLALTSATVESANVNRRGWIRSCQTH